MKILKGALLLNIYLELFNIAFRILLGGLLVVSGATGLGWEQKVATLITTANGLFGLVEGIVLVIALILAAELKVIKLFKK